MNHNKLINETAEFVQKKLQNAEGGHDWFHIKRVWQNAKLIAQTESCDGFIVELGALLHDIADSKFHEGDETLGPAIASEYLHSHNIDESIISHVINIIKHISFKGGNEVQGFKSLELDVVQDADRLDAIGAIGIARAFNYGGFKNRKLYDPSVSVKLNKTKEEYKNNTEPTINHFYDKLLLLKERMNTNTGKKMAEERHAFMVQYLDQFYFEIGEKFY
jgi:uncharacterized protein